MSDREPISLALRFRVLTRDRFTCVYCGAHPPEAVLVVDHAQSVADGGLTIEANLVTACEPCNTGKGGGTVVPPRRQRHPMDVVRDEVWTAVVEDYLQPLLQGEFRDAYGERPGFSGDDVAEFIEDIEILIASRSRG